MKLLHRLGITKRSLSTNSVTADTALLKRLISFEAREVRADSRRLLQFRACRRNGKLGSRIQWAAAGWAFVAAAASAGAAGPPLAITNFTKAGTGSVVLRWSAETNAFTNLFFTVEGKTSLTSNFAALSVPISEAASLAFTDTVLSAGRQAFYRVGAPSAYTALNQTGAFAAYPATNVGGLNTAGCSGAIFDGRYVYFVPHQNGDGYTGRVLRYDTQGGFNTASSWAAYDAANTGTGTAVGYTGGVFDGRYVKCGELDSLQCRSHERSGHHRLPGSNLRWPVRLFRAAFQ
jgi:hypothetical protein